MDMFQGLYDSWYNEQIQHSGGNRRARLIEGHGHAEQVFLRHVWYPAFRSFEHLHPEYEVSDFRDGSRFIDFAYIRYPFMLAIEIDGYGRIPRKPHAPSSPIH